MAKKKVDRRRKFRRRAGPICWIVSLLALAAVGYLIFELIRLDILPVYMMILVCLGLILVSFLIIRFWLFKSRRPISRYLTGLIVIILALSCSLAGKYVKDTSIMLDRVTDLTDKMANTVTVYAMINNMDSEKDLDQTSLGVMRQEEPEGTQGLLDSLDKKEIHPQTVEYDSVYQLVDDLYNGEISAIALPEQLHDALNEAANDVNRYNALTTFTNVVDQYIYYTDRDASMLNPADPVNNVMTDPFVVLISGNDSYGTLNSVSRSDVNMLVAINPKTAEILMVSLPRDTYTEITCKKNQTACEGLQGQFDKLTHSGLYGVGTTESTVEDLLDVPINYTVRLNFSSLINIVDAIGGIEVEVEPGLEVETFYANGTEGVKAGWNHLDGERALAFSRERHAYSDGDNQRVKNQQTVMKALIRAMISPSMISNYPKVMEALSTAFETNMSTKDVKRLLTLELSRFPNWNIQSVALVNSSSMEYSPSVQGFASVTLADEGQLQTVHDLIMDVLNGNNPVIPDIYSTSSNTFHTSEDGTAEQVNEYSSEYYDPNTYQQPVDVYDNAWSEQYSDQQTDLYDQGASVNEEPLSEPENNETIFDEGQHYDPEVFVEPLP
ncbi:LCP family protein [Ileibacterium valens]|uniref:LCP family protein n=1 Tax=Ileibacterium valens TaxID=1862668 RepID=UPI002355D430|nr:LCP family protein [Ileibacterium valens]